MTSTKSKITSSKLSKLVLENSSIMEEVLRNLQFVDIQRLQKVSRGIRSSVDGLRPEIKSYAVHIYSTENFINIAPVNCSEIKINYRTDTMPLFLSCHRDFTCEGDDILEMVLNDFKTIFEHQKDCLEKLSINFILFRSFSNLIDPRKMSEFSALLGELLQQRNELLKVRNLSIQPLDQESVFHILTNLDPNSLKKITILRPAMPMRFEIDEICQTEQWNNAEELLIEYCTATAPISEMNITHFSNVRIQVQTLSSEDVVFLTRKLLKSTTFRRFEIRCGTSNINDRIFDVIGARPAETLQGKTWKLPMNNGDTLKIVTNMMGIYFIRVGKSRKPIL